MPSGATKQRRATRRRRRRRKTFHIPTSAVSHQVDGEHAQSWLEPQAGDLLLDVVYLQDQTEEQKNEHFRSVYARAAVVMATATIEAATNDAIALMYAAMTSDISAEDMRKPPWVHFRGRSTDRMAALFRRGSFHRKREYVLSQIERVSGTTLPRELAREIEILTKLRNRIVHTNSLARPDTFGSLTKGDEVVRIVERASNAARSYLDFVSRHLSDMQLPVQARPRPHAGADPGQA